MENKLKRILAAVLEVEKNKINENSSVETIANWDSLKQMNIIVALEEEFNIEFNDEEILLLNNYKSIQISINEKLQY
jgi:acyl carrier protein